MEKTFKLEIISPVRVVFSDDVTQVKAPGKMGYFGVLPNHAPFLTHLRTGAVEVEKDGKTITFAVTGGFSEVLNNKMVILADAAESIEEIDIERATKARDRAAKRLEDKQPDTDIPRAQAALARALNRLEVASKR
jgi:F-type H+-transporting ATPase subunit epsilon